MQAGVVLNPHTHVSVLEDIISDLDLVLLMSVNPGFGGQKFIDNTYHKITQLKELILRKNTHALIEIRQLMKISNCIKEFTPVNNAVVTIGTFDGVHLGHRAIFDKMKEQAAEFDGETVVITFYPHPRIVLGLDSKHLKFINTQEKKIDPEFLLRKQTLYQRHSNQTYRQ